MKTKTTKTTTQRAEWQRELKTLRRAHEACARREQKNETGHTKAMSAAVRAYNKTVAAIKTARAKDRRGFLRELTKINARAAILEQRLATI